MHTTELLPPPSESAVAPAAVSAPYHEPNAEGIFEQYERVMLPGLPVKCAGEFYIAWTVAGGAKAFQAGWFLVMQQPKNNSKSLPRTNGTAHATRAEALRWLIDEVAAPFFSDHKGARTRLAAWRAKVLPEVVVEASEPAAAVLAPEPIAEPMAAVAPAAAVGSAFGSIPVDEIELNPHNPRTEIDEAELAELADSIKAQGGLIQAIAVRDLGTDVKPRYRLIAGERRWRAHQLLRWTMIEAKVFVGVDDAKAEEMALIENLQRAQLNPMEEALGFVGLRDRHGYTNEKISERTGRSPLVVSQMSALTLLPLSLQSLVRTGVLSKSIARELVTERWILSAVEKEAAQAKRVRLGGAAKHGNHDLARELRAVMQRPEFCEVLAKWVIESKARLLDLEAQQAPRAAMEALKNAKLVAEVSDYRAQIDVNSAALIVEASDTSLWHLAPAQWKAEKAELDRLAKEKQAADEAKAAARVRTALVERVNVRTEDLARGNLKYASLMGEEARYAAHLPAEMVAEGIDEQDRETLVCLKPEALKALKVREAELIARDTAAKLPALVERAVATVKRIKKIGGRELAFIIDTAQRGQAGMQWTALDGKAFSDLGLPPPEDLTRQSLAEMEPVDLARVAILSTLYNSKHGELSGALRWVLNIEDLGLAEESAERREALLAAAASEVFPPVELDPKRLGEWQRAHGLGMPVAEIARSYGVAEADVRGALGLGNDPNHQRARTENTSL